MSRNLLNVTVLNSYIHNVFASEELLHNIGLCGEICGYREVKGHAYFDIKDENSSLPARCFNCAKTYRPHDGESVILYGGVDFYAKRGEASFIAEKIEPLGAGLSALKLEKLKKELSEKGLFAEEHKKPIPKFPTRVCVVTSGSGAVIKDIITTVRKRNFAIDIAVSDARVQGVDSVRSIVTALKTADELGYDVIIIARGGGSAQDLMPFNDEALVYAVYDCVTPIISSVGHETDFTLCDLAADARAATPTAAAQLVAYDEREIKLYFDALARRMSKAFVRLYDTKINRTSALGDRLTASLARLCAADEQKLAVGLLTLKHGVETIFEGKSTILNAYVLALSAHNPAAVLAKGYFALSGTLDKNPILSVLALKKGDTVNITGKGGMAEAVIGDVKYEV